MRLTLTGVPPDTRPWWVFMTRWYFLRRAAIGAGVALALAWLAPVAFRGDLPYAGRAKLNRTKLGTGNGTDVFVGRDFRFADATTAECLRCRFVSVDFEGTRFEFADLRGVIFGATTLNECDFRNADLRDSRFFASGMSGAKFAEANIQGADFSEGEITPEQAKAARNWVLAFLPEATREGLNLPADHNARLLRRDLRGLQFPHLARLKQTLYEPDLHDMDLRNVDFEGEDLGGANVAQADLRGAKLDGVSLLNAKLDGCDLRGVDLSRVVNLTRPQLNSAVTDKKTRFPEGFE